MTPHSATWGLADGSLNQPSANASAMPASRESGSVAGGTVVAGAASIVVTGTDSTVESSGSGATVVGTVVAASIGATASGGLSAAGSIGRP